MPRPTVDITQKLLTNGKAKKLTKKQKLLYSKGGVIKTQEIDWQAEYQKKDEMYKELARLIAKKNCDYHSLRAKFLRMRKECAAENERAVAAEEALSTYTQETIHQSEYDSLLQKLADRTKAYNEQKERASAAEERELKIKDFLEDIMYASTYSTDVTFEEIGKAKEIYKSIYGELSYEKGNR